MNNYYKMLISITPWMFIVQPQIRKGMFILFYLSWEVILGWVFQKLNVNI